MHCVWQCASYVNVKVSRKSSWILRCRVYKYLKKKRATNTKFKCKINCGKQKEITASTKRILFTNILRSVSTKTWSSSNTARESKRGWMRQVALQRPKGESEMRTE